MASKTPPGLRQQVRVPGTTIQNTADRDRVREHQSHNLKRNDRVERGCGRNVDKGEDSTEQAGEDDGVLRNLLGQIRLGEPRGERKVLISGECECLTRGRGIERDIAEDDKDEDKYCEGIDTRCIDGITERVDKGKAGGIGRSTVHRWHGEKVGDEEGERNDPVSHIAPEHGSRHVDASIL